MKEALTWMNSSVVTLIMQGCNQEGQKSAENCECFFANEKICHVM